VQQKISAYQETMRLLADRPNEGDSVVVCCELTKPLEPGKGGILRFRCRVR
jgi:hypothetical protein